LALDDTTWIPSLLFAALGCFFLQKAVRRGAKQSWTWGRSGGEVPISRWGYAAWAMAFFSIAVIVAHPRQPPIESIVVFLASFVAIMAAGVRDTCRYNRARRGSAERGPAGWGS